LAILPPNAEVISDIPVMSDSPASYVTVSSSYNFGKAAVALFQAIFAILTLVRSTDGDQVEFYGYASFSLTVAPYGIMSLVNLVANLACPTYPSLYMVRNTVMDEAELRFGKTFEGVVGRLKPLAEAAAPAHANRNEESQGIDWRPSPLRTWLAKTNGISEKQLAAVV
jgi:hypothetical protein